MLAWGQCPDNSFCNASHQPSVTSCRADADGSPGCRIARNTRVLLILAWGQCPDNSLCQTMKPNVRHYLPS